MNHTPTERALGRPLRRCRGGAAEARSWRSFVFAVFAISPPCAAHAAAVPPPQLVAGHGLVALVRGPAAAIYDRDGRLVARLPPRVGGGVGAASSGLPSDGPPLPDMDGRAGDRERVREIRERLLDRLDVPDELRDRQEALDAADDELPLGLRRRERAAVPADSGGAGPLSPAFVARGPDGLVVIAGDAIWQVRGNHVPARVGPAPPGIRAIAATAAGIVVVARAGDILASADGGRRFELVTRIAVPARELVVDPAGAFLAVAAPGRIEIVPLGPETSPARLILRPRAAVHGMAACGGRLALVADDGLHVVERSGTDQVIARLTPGMQLRCPAANTGAVLLLGPAGLLVSHDGGRSFHAADTGGAPALAAAVDGGDVWIYTGGFAPVRLDPEGGGPAAAPVGPRANAPLGGDTLVPEVRPRAWARLLPHLSAVGFAGATLGRRTVGVGLVAEWRLAAADLPVLPSLPTSGDARRAPAQLAIRADPDVACLGETRALAVARAAAEPERARALLTRAGRAAWLPELRLRAEHRVGRSESVDFKPSAASDALGLDSQNDVRYEVRATWDLPRLVFSPEELGAAAQAQRIAETRREIESQVNRLYYERRRLLADAEAAASDEALTWQIRLEELEADLDTLSGGGFSRCRRAPRGQTPEVP